MKMSYINIYWAMLIIDYLMNMMIKFSIYIVNINTEF